MRSKFEKLLRRSHSVCLKRRHWGSQENSLSRSPRVSLKFKAPKTWAGCRPHMSSHATAQRPPSLQGNCKVCQKKLKNVKSVMSTPGSGHVHIQAFRAGVLQQPLASWPLGFFGQRGGNGCGGN